MLSVLACSVVAMTRPYTVPRRDLLAAAAAIPASGFMDVDAAIAAATAAPVKPFKQQTGLKLNTGVNFPTASFGLQVYDDDLGEKLTLIALEAGYRNFFASVLARNQKGFAKAIKKSGIPREDLYICGSVLSNQAQGFDAAKKLSARGCKENLEAFAVGGIDYVDVTTQRHHTPDLQPLFCRPSLTPCLVPTPPRGTQMIMLDYPGPDSDSVRGQWAALEEMAKQGTTKALAVSNFSPAQLDVVINSAGKTVPTCNQLPYGVGFAGYYQGRMGASAAQIVAENTKRGVVVQAWSPLQRALRGSSGATCAEIGQKYGKTAAQVALRWIADTGATYTTAGTKSLGKAQQRFPENIDIFDFSLTKEEVALLSTL